MESEIYKFTYKEREYQYEIVEITSKIMEIVTLLPRIHNYKFYTKPGDDLVWIPTCNIRNIDIEQAKAQGKDLLKEEIDKLRSEIEGNPEKFLTLRI